MTTDNIKVVNESLQELMKIIAHLERFYEIDQTCIGKMNKCINAIRHKTQESCTHKFDDGKSAIRSGMFYDNCEICGGEW